jgi:hypothetical protein
MPSKIVAIRRRQGLGECNAMFVAAPWSDSSVQSESSAIVIIPTFLSLSLKVVAYAAPDRNVHKIYVQDDKKIARC